MKVGGWLLARSSLRADSGVITDQFYSERLYGRRQISTLLRGFGFTTLRFTPLRGESDRGQDLGMMSHRFVLSAQLPASGAAPTGTVESSTPHRPSERTEAVRELRYVAVVLGDPRQPDETKRGGVFGEDDYDVISRLKSSLTSLPSYEFIYFDDHDTLYEHLEIYGDAVDLVFNLCDEGLHNQPRQELHVPALLDALGIPYTGAGAAVPRSVL